MVILESSKLLGPISPHSCHKHSATFCPSHVKNASVRMSLASNLSSSNPILMTNERTRVCELFDLHKKLIHYDEAWTWQKSVVREKKALLDRNEDFPDTLVVLQHHPVFTLGTGSSKEYLNFDIKNASYDVYQTERGGEVTYHGPGQVIFRLHCMPLMLFILYICTKFISRDQGSCQLVVYPIINLRNHKMDLHWYLRALEEVVIRVLSLTFSIKACRIEGFTGVWVGNQKLAAIGIRVFQWITYHGLALNVTTDLTPFQQIVPCGIKDREVGSIEGTLRELGLSNRWETPTPDLVDCQLIEVAHKALVKEFSEVFQVELHWKPISMLG